jgi:2'-hydroxyisoflavone reductase
LKSLCQNSVSPIAGGFRRVASKNISMKLLILGGTVFLGRYLIESAQNRGYEVAMFNRGRHGSELFPEVEKLRGDRRVDLSALIGGRWDAVIDTCGYVPSEVRASAALLSDSVQHYTFISSQSVYANFDVAGIDETHPVKKLTYEEVERAESIKPGDGIIAVSYGDLYGGLKALCEETIEDEMPGQSLSIRSGLIVGPYDYSDRFTYWVRRAAAGGEVLAPGHADSPIQLVDVRDLADWIIQMVEIRQTGTFNATGPEKRMTMKEMLDTCRAASSSDATFTWVSEQFLKDADVAGWSELPLWLPSEDNVINFFAVDCSEAIESGLKFRPLTATVYDTLEWDKSRNTVLRAGLAREKEIELLRTWHDTL